MKKSWNFQWKQIENFYVELSNPIPFHPFIPPRCNIHLRYFLLFNSSAKILSVFLSAELWSRIEYRETFNWFKFVVDDMKHKKSLTCLVVKGEGRHYSRCDIFENESIIKAVLNKGLTFSHTHCTTESQTKCKWHPKFKCKWHFKLKCIFIHSSFYESSVMTVFAENLKDFISALTSHSLSFYMQLQKVW